MRHQNREPRALLRPQAMSLVSQQPPVSASGPQVAHLSGGGTGPPSFGEALRTESQAAAQQEQQQEQRLPSSEDVVRPTLEGVPFSTVRR